MAIESGNMVEWMSEKNYMFRLSDFGDELLKWLDTGGEWFTLYVLGDTGGM